MTTRQTDLLLTMADALLRDSAARRSPHDEVFEALTSLIHSATHDTLTGLPSRGVVLERLERELARDAAAGEQVAVFFIDLDNFKLVNDSLGHDSGDELLREMARRIGSCVSEGDTVSRFGGDELVVLHPRAHDGSERELGSRMLAVIAEPMRLAGRETAVSASIGLAACAPGTRSAEQLLRDADTAVYVAKSRGRNRIERFNDELNARVVRRMRIESDLRVALRNAEIDVHYQPQVSLATGRIVGVEALARWRHPDFGMVPPAEFIPIAEESRLIGELGAQVLRSACLRLAQWSSVMPGRQLTMTVNISPRQLDDPGFVAGLREVLDETGVSPSSLCLELTESALIEPGTDVVDVLEQVGRLGIYIAIDDFGTDHSALARLRDLPVEVLRIDRDFIDGLFSERGDTAIVSSILSLAFAMGKHVIAEGVERSEQALALRDMGCPVAQGFFFSPPVEPGRIVAMVDRALWQPPGRDGSPPIHRDARERRAHRAFIDEFLDHIGAPMGARPGAAR